MHRILHFLNSTFANSIAKSVYYIIPLSIAITRGVNHGTDIFLFSFELYFFLMFTIYQSIEYMTTTYLSDSNTFDNTSFFSGILISGPILSITVYFVYLVLLKILLPHISYYGDEELKVIYSNLILFSLPLFFIPLSAAMVGLFNSRKLFLYSSIGSLSGLATFLIFIAVFKSYIGHYLILAIFTSEIIRFLVLFIIANKKIIRIRFPFSYPREYWIKTGYYWSSSLIGALFPPFLSIFASHFETGTVSVLSYSLKIFYMVTGIFNGAMAVLLVEWSKLLTSKFESVKNRINKDLKLCFFSGLITAIIGYFLWPYILPLLFKKIMNEHRLLFSFFVNIQLLSIPFYVIQLALLRFFIAIKTTRILITFAILRLVFIAVTSIVLTHWFYTKGIPIAICFTEIAMTGLFFVGYLTHSKTAISLSQI